MTEDEAKTKWCPMVRHVVGNEIVETSANRVGLDDNPEISRCIASECMWWVWDSVTKLDSGHCGAIK